MGCDIHLFHEMRCQTTERWLPCDVWEKDADGVIDIPYGRHIYNGRNYTLFAALADVRNRTKGEELAYIKNSCDGGDPIPVIQSPRGVPADTCEEIQTCSERWGADGHSHSYYTLRELLDFDWHATVIVNRGLVSDKEEINRVERMRSFYAKNCPHKVDYVGPDSYCLGSSNDDSVVMEWKSTLGSDCGAFLSEVIPRLSALAKIYDIPYTDIRVVFFFDN
jgi:hypothetical protein